MTARIRVLLQEKVTSAFMHKFMKLTKGQLFALRKTLQTQAATNDKVWRELSALGNYLSYNEVYSH